jgi:hypothetical protein
MAKSVVSCGSKVWKMKENNRRVEATERMLSIGYGGREFFLQEYSGQIVKLVTHSVCCC